jgi:2-haloalkanoic acid dehalogenase type II
VKLSDFKVLTLDCYGTLIDWEAGISTALMPLASKAPGAISREQLLQTFAKHEAAQQAQTPAMPYSQLLSVVYQRLAAEWGLKASSDEAAAFGASVADWPEFSDSVGALQYLQGHYKLVILSNVDRMSFRASNERLKVDFDAIYCAQDIGSYKPDPRNFEYMLRRLKTDFGLDRPDILHTAQSLFHDHVLANQFGVASAWINRHHERQGGGATLAPAITPKYDFRFDDMAGLVLAHQRELR